MNEESREEGAGPTDQPEPTGQDRRRQSGQKRRTSRREESGVSLELRKEMAAFFNELRHQLTSVGSGSSNPGRREVRAPRPPTRSDTDRPVDPSIFSDPPWLEEYKKKVQEHRQEAEQKEPQNTKS